MKIMELYIYGYGKFENTRFSSLNDQQVFFGENEAGKSTIMSFIHSILFGFPTKQQSDLRYEPKKGAKYGGQITAFFPDTGKVVIERVKGKAVGDVLVTLENGEIGGEELLTKLMVGIDKTLYQSIFSFNLLGLQNVHQMKEEDIGRFLFSTGTVGSDRLMKVENELSKELESRFKPSGRNPSLNVKVKELQQLHKELRKAEENNEQYLRLLQTKEAVERQITEVKSTISKLSGQYSYFEEWRKVSPLFEQGEKIKKELSRYEAIHFPEKGLEQLDHLLTMENELNRKITGFKQRVELLSTELNSLMPNLPLIAMENEMNGVLERLPLVEKWTQENIRYQVRFKKIEEDIRQLQQQINALFSKEEIYSINTSVFMKEKTEALQSWQKRMIEKKRDLDEKFKEEKRRLEEYEWKEQELKKELMSESEAQKIQEQISLKGTKETLSFQKKEITDKLSFLQMTVEQAEEKRKGEILRYSLFAILFALLCGWGAISNVVELIVAGGIGIIISVIFLVKVVRVKGTEHLRAEIKNLQLKKNSVESELEMPTGQEELLKNKLEKDSNVREKLYQLSVKIENQQESYDLVIDRYEEWEKEELQLKKELLAVGKQLQVPEDIALTYIYDAFKIIAEMKKMYQEKEYLEEQWRTNEISIADVGKQIEKWSQQFLSKNGMPLQEAVLLLKRKLREELEKQIQYKEKKEQYLLIQEELKSLQMEQERISSGICELYNLASVQNDEEFRDIASKAAQKKILKEEWSRLQVQLRLSSFDESEAKQLINDFSESTLEGIENQQEKLEEQLSSLQDELAALKYKIQLIEDGGTYAELYHHFKLLESAFNEEAKEWIRYASAKEILQKTVMHYKQDRLPKMLQKAEEYLHFLTGGNYRRIIPKQEGSGFYIEREDQLLFDANELSQATTEQIYVAIRLALTVTLYDQYKFPLIIDDSFVNFDAARTNRVFDLLLNHTDHQVLFFTCHKQHLTYFSNESMIFL